jgi:hypothetical protein
MRRERRRQWLDAGALAVAGIFAIAALAAGAVPARAQDDWQVIERHTTQSPPSEAKPAQSAPAQGANATIVACGERARPAGEPYRSIMSRLNEMYGTDYHIYESVRPYQPHARTGGCIFYNRQELASLVGKWMGVSDSGAQNPMLYAIFAHEFAHEYHGDVDSSPSPGGVRARELAADRFAGYTLERLGIPRLDPDQVAFYYRVIGDDFLGGVGRADAHGTAADRTTALEDGWKRAEMGLPESGGEPAGGFGQP